MSSLFEDGALNLCGHCAIKSGHTDLLATWDQREIAALMSKKDFQDHDF